MLASVPEFLKRRATRSFQYLMKEVEAVTPEQALADRRAGWPGQQWGIGQDGSIAGIVYHVASWKHLSLPLFEPGGGILALADFNASAAPASDDWPALVTWLRTVGTQWSDKLSALPEEAFAAVHQFDEWESPLWEFVVEFYEHDIQHAAQIEYLRQRHALPTNSGESAGNE